MSDENKTISTGEAVKMSPDQIKKLEKELTAAFKENRFVEVKKLAEQIKTSDPANHLADRLMEKMEKTKAEQLKKANAGRVKDLEMRIKEAYKEGQLMDIAKIASEMKKIDPENKLMKKIEAQIDKAKAALDAQVKKERIKGLEIVIKDLFKNKKWDESVKKANDLLRLDQKSGVALKALAASAKAKGVDISSLVTVLPAQSTSADKKSAANANTEQKKPGFFARLFGKKAGENLNTDLKKADVNKTSVLKLSSMPSATVAAKIETKPNVSAVMPDKKAEDLKITEKKPEFFNQLFGKKTEISPKSDIKTDAQKPAVPGAQPVTAKPAEVKKDVMPADKNPLTDKEKIKSLENALNEALKEKNNFSIKSAIDELRKNDPENKSAKKAELKLAEEKEKLEKQARKEKINGLTGEIKTHLKNEDWDKAVLKSNELLEVDPSNSFALDSIKKAAKAKNVDYKSLVKVSVAAASEKKPGLLSGLFNKAKEPLKPAETAIGTAKPLAAMPVKTDLKEIQKAVTPNATPAVTQVSSEPVKTEVKEAQKSIAPAITPAVTQPQVAELPKKIETIIPVAVNPSAFSAPKPSMIKPVAPATPPITTFKPVVVDKPAEQKTIAPVSVQPLKQSDSNHEKGNIFTKLFGKEQESEKPTGSIIETIVAQSVKENRVTREVAKTTGDTGEGFFRFANMFLRFSIVFMITGAAFFYIYNIDKNNTILQLAGIENNALKLKNASAELDTINKKMKDTQKEIDKYIKGYEDQYKATIDKIIEKRMDWPALIKKLNEVTESVYEKNALAQYVQYNNYSFDVEAGTLTVSATLSDPLGKNLTKLAELEEAFTYYPKDKNDSNDKRKPYFQNMQEFRSFDKSLNKATGRYISNFSLSLSTKDQDTTKK